jgi:hypothetical protein
MRCPCAARTSWPCADPSQDFYTRSPRWFFPVYGTIIATGASITFDLLFENGDKVVALKAARDEDAKRKAQAEISPISVEARETSFDVIPTAGAIHFKTGSAELDHKSDPILQSVADIANRCPTAKIEVTGHTDSDGDKETKKKLSEQRPHAVMSSSCSAASPPRASKPQATATRVPSLPTIPRPIGRKTVASNSACWHIKDLPIELYPAILRTRRSNIHSPTQPDQGQQHQK